MIKSVNNHKPFINKNYDQEDNNYKIWNQDYAPIPKEYNFPQTTTNLPVNEKRMKEIVNPIKYEEEKKPLIPTEDYNMNVKRPLPVRPKESKYS